MSDNANRSQLYGVSDALQLDGLNELLTQMGKIGVPDEAIKEGNKRVAALVISQAKMDANFKNPTGRLLGSLRASNLKNRVVVRAGSKRLPYANPIHWGWFYDRNNFIYKNIKPNPFLSRALGYKREQILETYNKQMQAMIDKYTPPKNVIIRKAT